MSKTPESLASPSSVKRPKRRTAAFGLAIALSITGCSAEGDASRGASSTSSAEESSLDTQQPSPKASQKPTEGLTVSPSQSETLTPPADGDAFATRRVCDGIYVADKGARVILRPVVNQHNQVLDIAEQSAGGVDFMPDPLTADTVEWFQLDGQPFPAGKAVACQDRELFMNRVAQPNGYETWQMSSVDHNLGGEPTSMPWSPNAIRGAFKGVHFDEGALSCAGLLTVVPGYNPKQC